VAKRAHVRLATRLRNQSAFFNSADVDTWKLERSGKVVLVIYWGKEVHVLGGVRRARLQFLQAFEHKGR